MMAAELKCENCIFYHKVCSAYGYCKIWSKLSIDIVSPYKSCPLHVAQLPFNAVYRAVKAQMLAQVERAKKATEPTAPPIGRCKDCANWYKQHCASGPCATEPTDAEFFCGNFEPKGGEGNG